VLVQGFDMFSGLTLEDAFLDKVRDTTAAATAKAAATSNSSTLLLLGLTSTFVEPFMMACKLYPAAAMGEVPSTTAPAIVIARGLEINTDFTVKHSNRQVSALCGVLVLDALMLLLATGLFLRPLEKVLHCHMVHLPQFSNIVMLMYDCCSVGAIGPCLYIVSVSVILEINC
jgi:hypothetical protein